MHHYSLLNQILIAALFGFIIFLCVQQFRRTKILKAVFKQNPNKYVIEILSRCGKWYVVDETTAWS